MMVYKTEAEIEANIDNHEDEITKTDLIKISDTIQAIPLNTETKPVQCDTISSQGLNVAVT